MVLVGFGVRVAVAVIVAAAICSESSSSAPVWFGKRPVTNATRVRARIAAAPTASTIASRFLGSPRLTCSGKGVPHAWQNEPTGTRAPHLGQMTDGKSTNDVLTSPRADTPFLYGAQRIR